MNIYIYQLEDRPDLYKIGQTHRDVDERIAEQVGHLPIKYKILFKERIDGVTDYDIMAELEKQGVPVNESTLAFVVKDDEEATKLAVANMANILNIQKREEAKSNPPKTSGGSDGGSKRGKDKFASAKITNF